MKNSKQKENSASFNRNYLYLFLISLASLAATFLISNSDATFQTKLSVFVLIVLSYLTMYGTVYLWKNKQTAEHSNEIVDKSIFSAEVEPTLLALEDANQFFGSSLKPADMFRLVASRINEVIPFAACAFYLADEKRDKLNVVYSSGVHLKTITGTEVDAGKGLAGKVFHSGKALSADALTLDKAVLPADALKNLSSAIAIPLLRHETVFGVFVLYAGEEKKFSQDSLRLFEAVGSRVAPLFVSSQAFENSLNNALTDALTNLPNERAFFLVLENQIAESQRFREQRPLTILVADIKNFAELNQKFGHSTGDRLLLFVTEKVKQQLRQMDFLARSFGDEFLAVLPTASEKITRDIVGRIEKSFITNPFEITGQEKIFLQLSFGAASFGKDGETANQLLNHALLRKKQSKSAESNSNVLWFPKEFVN